MLPGVKHSGEPLFGGKRRKCLSDLEWLTVNAMKSSFWPFDKRLRIINERIKPGYAALKASGLGSNVTA